MQELLLQIRDSAQGWDSPSGAILRFKYRKLHRNSKLAYYKASVKIMAW